MKQTAKLRYSVPRYLIETEMRKRYPDGEYPLSWDISLDEDIRFANDDDLPRMKSGRMLTYEAAIDYARYEHARKFYNQYLSAVIREKQPVKVSAETLFREFQQKRAELEATGKPGIDITFSDLVIVLNDIIEQYGADDHDFTKTHRTILKHTRDIIADENAFEIPEKI